MQKLTKILDWIWVKIFNQEPSFVSPDHWNKAEDHVINSELADLAPRLEQKGDKWKTS